MDDGIGYFPFNGYYRKKNRKDCDSFKELSLFALACLVSALGYIDYIESWRLVISIALIVAEGLMVIQLNRVIKFCDEDTRSEIKSYKATIESLENTANELSSGDVEKERLIADNLVLRSTNERITATYNETTLLVDEIAEANKTLNPKSLYVSLANSIQQLFLTYAKINKENFSINIYVYNRKSKTIGRFCAYSYGVGVPKGDTKQYRKINEVKKYYYVDCVKRNDKNRFILLNNEEIRSKLYFGDPSDGNRFTQYIGHSHKLTSSSKLYFEIITYNDLVVSDTRDGMDDLLDYIFDPITKLLTAVSWKQMEV